MCSHREDFIDYTSYDEDSLDCGFEDAVYDLAEEMMYADEESADADAERY